MRLTRPTLVLLSVAFAACGGSDQESGSSAPTLDQDDSALIQSAEVTAEEHDALGFTPSEEAFIRIIANSCGGTVPCQCAAEALVRDVPPAEMSLTLLTGAKGQRVLREALIEGVKACSDGEPPDRIRAAAALVPEGPVTVTPADVVAMTGGEFTHEHARAAFVRDCSRLASEESCGCRYDDLAEQLDVSEFFVLALNFPEALDSSYLAEASEACSEA